MRVHHLNCGTLCPLAAKTFLVGRERMVCHCLLIETDDGLVLVDSGFGQADVDGTQPLPLLLRTFARPEPGLRETARAQIEALGFRPDDVRHIVMTHLDVDHAGGLSDFPRAKVHVMKLEQQAAPTTSGSSGSLKSDRCAHHLPLRHAGAGESPLGGERSRSRAPARLGEHRQAAARTSRSADGGDTPQGDRPAPRAR